MKIENEQVKQLIESAESYADFAVENLWLEPESKEPLPEVDDNSVLINGIMELAKVAPFAFAPHERFAIHFMFPQLTAEERQLLESLKALRGTQDTVEDFMADRYRHAKSQVENSEIMQRLTALQLDLLDSPYFSA